MKLKIILLFCLSVSIHAAVLVEKTEIVIPADALAVEKFAASELALHVKLVTGTALPVVTAPGAANARIYLGRASNLDLTGLEKNAAKVRIAGNRIDIAGVDGSGEALNRSTAAGTLFGVYDLLEKELGIRWLWPGAQGTLAPAQASIPLNDGEWTVKPPLRFANWRQSCNPAAWSNPKNATKFRDDEALWLRRHRFSMIDNLNHGHAFTKYLERFGQSNPEYFNLLPDGTRRPDPLFYNGRPDLVSMCVTDRGLIARVVEDWQSGKPSDIINCNENDTAGKCVCPNCMAADADTDSGRLERARREFSTKNPQWHRELGSLSERYAKFYQAVQQEADKVNPAHRIIGCIYANYYEPPVNTKLNERIILRFCPPIMYPWTDAKVAMFKRLWQGWADNGVSLMFRPNFTLDGHNFPLVYYRDFVDCFDFARDHGLIASDMDSLTGMYGANGLTNYIIASKHGSGMNKSIAELENDYFAAFGAAAPAMREYYSVLEKATRQGKGGDSNFIEGGNYADFFLQADTIFTPKIMQRSFELLDTALKNAAGDPAATARIKFVRMGLEDAALVMDTQRGFRQYKKDGKTGEFTRNLKKLKQFRQDHEQYGYANISVSSYLEGRHWPLHLALLDDNSRELENWAIRFDPRNSGINEKWFAEKSGDWEPIGTDSHWEKQPPGLKWAESHGAPFKGVGWYRTSFNVKSVGKDQLLKLTFGAVDGSAGIWLNGQKIADRPFPYQGDPDSWKKPFEIDITGKAVEGENHLVVRVEKQNGLSGIWRPIYLSLEEADSVGPHPGNVLTGDWKADIRSGKFTFQFKKYPLVIDCTEAGDANAYKGVWGRLHQNIPVVKGQAYDFRVRFRTPQGFNARFDIWLRSSAQPGLNRGNINLSSPGTDGKEKVLRGRIIPDADKCTVFLNLVNGTGKLEILSAELYPAAKPQD